MFDFLRVLNHEAQYLLARLDIRMARTSYKAEDKSRGSHKKPGGRGWDQGLAVEMGGRD